MEMEIAWTCTKCEHISKQTREVWENIYGQYVAVECPACLVEHEVYLDSEVA